MFEYSTRWWYVLLFLLFFIDVLAASFFEQPVIFGLLSFYIFSLFLQIKNGQRALGLFLICCEHFLFGSPFGLPLLYLIPVTLLTLKIRPILNPNLLLPFFVLLGCLGLQFLVEPSIMPLFSAKIYTIGNVFATIIVMILLSLKYKSTRN